ncbi:MAG TPA: CAP domain-containing protein [Polyangiaceae bacterium]
MPSNVAALAILASILACTACATAPATEPWESDPTASHAGSAGTSGTPGGGTDDGAGATSSGGGESSSGAGGGSGGGETGGSSDAGAGETGGPSGACASTAVRIDVVDYFTGSPVKAEATADGASAGSGSSFCLAVGTGLHPVTIGASGYATYNGAIQLPGGATKRSVRLFPVGPSLAGWLALVNSDRQANGSPPVQLDDGLTIAAWDHAVDMGTQNYFAHFDPHGFAPTTRSLLLGSMLIGAESCAAGATTYQEAESEFMAEKSSLPNQSPSDCAQDDSLAGHYCNLVWASHNWVGLAIVDVPGSTYETYFDQEFGDLYGYYDTTVLPPEPALGANGALSMLPSTGFSFSDEYVATMPAPTPIAIATLNADPTCASSCPATDEWYPDGGTDVGGAAPSPVHPPFAASQLVFVAMDSTATTFESSSAWAAFWPGGTVLPESYGAGSEKYLVE